jgi:dGTP triphosphohydrolase
VIKCLRKAQKRQKDLVCVLIRHEDELDSIKTILQQLDKKENSDLHTASLGAELSRMQQVQHQLAALLKELDPGSKTKINQFARQLFEGSQDEKNLSSIMNELAHIKASILLCIQMANVGVMRDMNKQIVADAAKIERIDSNLQKHLEQLDGFEGLRIRKLIKGRRLSSKLLTIFATRLPHHLPAQTMEPFPLPKPISNP